MCDSLFNVMNQERLSDAVKQAVNTCRAPDILIPALCIGLTNGTESEDFAQTSPMVAVEEYRDYLSDNMFKLHTSALEHEEDKLRKLEYMISALEAKEEMFGIVTDNELSFYDGMLEQITSGQNVSMEAGKLIGGRLGDEGDPKTFSTMVKSLYNFFLTIFKLIFNTIGNLIFVFSRAVNMAGKVTTLASEIMDKIEVYYGTRPAFVPKELISRADYQATRRVKDTKKAILDSITGLNTVDIFNGPAFYKVTESITKVMPGDLTVGTKTEYITSLLLTPSATEGTVKLPSGEFRKFIAGLEKRDAKAMGSITKQLSKLKKTVTKHSEAIDTYEAKLSSNDAAKLNELQDVKRRVGFINRFISIVSISGKELANEEERIFSLLKKVKPSGED